MTDTLSFAADGECDLVMARTFAAPQARLFRALTTPGDLRRWMLGPPGWTLDVCDLDLRPGGAMRFVWRQGDGASMGLSGAYREIAAPDRIVHTELFDLDWTGGETVVTTRLDEAAGRTRLTTTVRYRTRAARDAAAGSGMKDGVAMSYDRLAGLVAAE